MVENGIDPIETREPNNMAKLTERGLKALAMTRGRHRDGDSASAGKNFA
jgi:hypothetical protein